MVAVKPWHLLVGCGLCTVVTIGVIILVVILVKRR
jgi:hypothetical protein